MDGATLTLDSSGATSFDMSGGSLTNGGAVSFASGQEITGVVFNSCAEIDTNGATFSTCTINDTTESTTGALVGNSSSEINNMSNITINNYSGKYAVYIPSSVTGTITLDNFQVDGSGTDIYWAGTNGTLTVNLTNGSNLTTSATAGGTVSIQNSVTVEVTNVVVGSRVRVDTVDGNGALSTNLISEEATSSTVSTSVNYSGLDYTAVSIRVRKSSGGTKYLPYSASGTITSSGLSAAANQIVDTLVDL